MNLFSSSQTPSLPAPKISTDGTPIAPDRSQRSRCWEGRDAYFSCLNANSITDPLKEEDKAKKLCSSEEKMFEANCATSWVTYFKKRRVMELQKEETLRKLREEGAIKIPGELAPPGKR